MHRTVRKKLECYLTIDSESGDNFLTSPEDQRRNGHGWNGRGGGDGGSKNRRYVCLTSHSPMFLI